MTQERSDVNRPARASPWPLFVAVGLVLSEVGVLFGTLALTVGGVLLLGGSCAGAIAESGYADSARGPLVAVGTVFVLLGLAAWLWGAAPWETLAALWRAPTTDGVAFRGASVLLAGGLLVAAGALHPLSPWGRA